MELLIPRLYAIVDAGCFQPDPDPARRLIPFAVELIAAGATLMQYRDKSGAAEVVSRGRALRQATAGAAARLRPRGVRLIMNDRADLCLAAGFDGVHLGQQDLSPTAARSIFARAAVANQLSHPVTPTEGVPETPLSHPVTPTEGVPGPPLSHPVTPTEGVPGTPLWVGISTHTDQQVREADSLPVDYIAVGPVFATRSKANPDPVIGVEGVRRARALTSKPLVAIGGITRENCRAVIAAGADSVAVISDLLSAPGKSVETFLRLLG